ncbi:MAG: hypothetical protein JRN39_03775 [Nitrososphaerota archaeon]|nr:hypothetical protein [Nitrososphaerota archaeon]MDG6939503.1 hypothetical protein [Nitrososphaerota archaeon]
MTSRTSMLGHVISVYRRGSPEPVMTGRYAFETKKMVLLKTEAGKKMVEKAGHIFASDDGRRFSASSLSGRPVEGWVRGD